MRPVNAVLIAGVSLTGLLASPAAHATPPCRPVPAGRPCVGLVLAGGGAKGLAHVGVLKVLDELDVPVDVIGGSSMGAIVGALYALGYSAEDLERELTAIDWRGILQDRPPREELAFRRKQDDLNFLVKFSLGIGRDGLKLPRALIHGRKLDAKLRSLTLTSASAATFDALPIPFRAVATDLETGVPVVLSRGDLARALRASMAIPGVFPPIEIDGRTLVDGGMSNNTPVDIVREELGADVVIVVDLRKLVKAEEITSAGAVFDQMLNIMISRNTARQLETLGPGDVLVQPDLTGIDTADFSKGREAIARGDAAARAHERALRALALTPQGHAQQLAQRSGATAHQQAGPAAALPPIIDEIVIDATTRVDREVISAKLQTTVGERLDMARLSRDLAELNGLDIFERVDASVVEQDGRSILTVHVEEKAWGPHYLKFGLNLEDDFSGGDSYNIALQQTTNPFNRLAGEWRNEVQLGHDARLFSEFYQPVDASGHYFIAPQIELAEGSGDVFEGGRRVAELRNRTVTVGADVGRTLGDWGEMRAGVKYLAHSDSNVRIGAESIARARFANGGYYGRIAHDSFDNPNFPHRGSVAEAGVGVIREHLGAEEDFEVLVLGAVTARTFGRQTVLLSGEFDTVLNDDDPATAGFSMGGLLQLSGYKRGELGGQHRALGRIITYHRLGQPEKLFAIPVYVGGSLELGAVEADLNDFSSERLLAAGSLFIGFDTPLGPLYVAYGYAEGGESSPYLFLGRTF